MACVFSVLSLLLLVAPPVWSDTEDLTAPSTLPDPGGPYYLIAVTPAFDPGTGHPVTATDYHLAGDDVGRLAIGDRLLVERERRLGPPVSDAVATLYVPVATVRVIHVGTASAVARLETDLPRQRHPHLTYRGPMVGDRLVPAPPAADNDIVLPSGVLFDLDRAEIRADARPILEEAATRLGTRPAGKIEVHGHTDSSGARAYNQRLSLRRARAIADYLAAAADIPRARFVILGHGENEPLADNTTAANRQLNRRVVVHLSAPVTD
jgi:outer membrane protein OmpA-like peptidoglycan-associated protein